MNIGVIMNRDRASRTMFNLPAVEAAERTAGCAIDGVLTGASGPRGVIVSAPAGAGKSHMIATAVGRARDRGMRVAVAAPTNDQAFGLVRKISELHCNRHPDRTVAFVPASEVILPDGVRSLPGVREVTTAQANGEKLIVGTLSKLGYSFSGGNLNPFDILLIDESYQADSGKYFAVGDLAPVHLLVGDSGQINPFTTIDNPDRWRGLPENPLQTAVAVLRRNHPHTPIHDMPITRRLDPRAVRLVQLLYPQLRFDSAVRPGTRELRLREIGSTRRLNRQLDRALDTAKREGWAQIELPRSAVVRTDPEIVDSIIHLVRRLFDRDPEARCESCPDFTALQPERVAIGVSHNDQKDQLRAALKHQGLRGVLVENANRLQGLEFEVVIVWQPLAGLQAPDDFHMDPGRLCVLLTRHRQFCIIVGREGDHEILEDQVPPSTPAYLGWDSDPILDGWDIHLQILSFLESVKVQLG